MGEIKKDAVLSAKDHVGRTPVPPGGSLLELVRSWPQIECDEFDRFMREMDENPVHSPVSAPPDFGS